MLKKFGLHNRSAIVINEHVFVDVESPQGSSQDP